MSVLISKVEIGKFDKLSIPWVVKLTFANGQIGTYDKRRGEDTQQEGQELKEPELTELRYDFSDQKLEESSFEAISEIYKAQIKTLEEDYKTMKKKLQSRLQALKGPVKRMETVLNWLRDSKVDELLEAAKMLESEAEYIIKKVQAQGDKKYEVFLSNVQRHSTDVIASLEKRGMRVCFDTSTDKVDKQGLINGILDSCVFAIILTTDFFEKPVCVFEYFISVVAGKVLLPTYELSPRHGGGHLESYELPSMFQHIGNYEFLQVNRHYWETFITRLYTRVRKISYPQSTNLTQVQWAWLESELKKEGRCIGGLLFASAWDGYTAKEFHTRCDGMGPTLTLIETSTGLIFGGFTSVSWTSKDTYVNTDDVWLFTQDGKGSFRRINIYPASVGNALYCHEKYGPTFGAGHDIHISPGSSYIKKATYEIAVGPEGKFEVKHCEVLQIVKVVV